MMICYSMIKPEGQRPPIQQVTDEIMAKISSQVPGVLPLLQPYPTLQIDTGAIRAICRANTPTNSPVRTRISSTHPPRKFMAKLRENKGFSIVSSLICG